MGLKDKKKPEDNHDNVRQEDVDTRSRTRSNTPYGIISVSRSTNQAENNDLLPANTNNAQTTLKIQKDEDEEIEENVQKGYNLRTRFVPQKNEVQDDSHRQNCIASFKKLITKPRFLKIYSESVLFGNFKEFVDLSIKILESASTNKSIVKLFATSALSYENYIHGLIVKADDINKIQNIYMISDSIRHDILVEALSNLKAKVESHLNTKSKANVDLHSLDVLLDVMISTLNDKVFYERQGEKVVETLFKKLTDDSNLSQSLENEQYTRHVRLGLESKVSERLERINVYNDPALYKIRSSELHNYIQLFYLKAREFASAPDITSQSSEGINDTLNSLLTFLNSAEYENIAELNTIEVWLTFHFNAYIGLKRDINYLLTILDDNKDANELLQYCRAIRNILSSMVVQGRRAKYLQFRESWNYSNNQKIGKDIEPEYYHYRSGKALVKYNLGIIARGSKILELIIDFISKTEKFAVNSNSSTIMNILDDLKLRILDFYNNAEFREAKNPNKWSNVYKYKADDFDALLGGLKENLPILERKPQITGLQKENRAMVIAASKLIDGLKELRQLRENVYETIAKPQRPNPNQYITAYPKRKNFKQLRNERLVEKVPEDILEKIEDEPEVPVKFNEVISTKRTKASTAKKAKQAKVLKTPQVDFKLDNIKFDDNQHINYHPYSNFMKAANIAVQTVAKGIKSGSKYATITQSFKNYSNSLADLVHSADIYFSKTSEKWFLNFKYDAAKHQLFSRVVEDLKRSIKTASKKHSSVVIPNYDPALSQVESLLASHKQEPEHYVETVELSNDPTVTSIVDEDDMIIDSERSLKIKQKEVLSDTMSLIKELKEIDESSQHSNVAKKLLPLTSELYAQAKDNALSEGFIDSVSDIVQSAKDIIAPVIDNDVEAHETSNENKINLLEKSISKLAAVHENVSRRSSLAKQTADKANISANFTINSDKKTVSANRSQLDLPEVELKGKINEAWGLDDSDLEIDFGKMEDYTISPFRSNDYEFNDNIIEGGDFEDDDVDDILDAFNNKKSMLIEKRSSNSIPLNAKDSLAKNKESNSISSNINNESAFINKSSDLDDRIRKQISILSTLTQNSGTKIPISLYYLLWDIASYMDNMKDKKRNISEELQNKLKLLVESSEDVTAKMDNLDNSRDNSDNIIFDNQSLRNLQLTLSITEAQFEASFSGASNKIISDAKTLEKDIRDYFSRGDKNANSALLNKSNLQEPLVASHASKAEKKIKKKYVLVLIQVRSCEKCSNDIYDLMKALY